MVRHFDVVYGGNGIERVRTKQIKDCHLGVGRHHAEEGKFNFPGFCSSIRKYDIFDVIHGM